MFSLSSGRMDTMATCREREEGGGRCVGKGDAECSRQRKRVRGAKRVRSCIIDFNLVNKYKIKLEPISIIASLRSSANSEMAVNTKKRCKLQAHDHVHSLGLALSSSQCRKQQLIGKNSNRKQRDTFR